MQLFDKRKIISGIFIAFLKSTRNLLYLEKNYLLDTLNIFRSYWLWKTLLLEFQKATVSENPSVVNLLTGPKRCTNLYGSTFILIFH